MSRLFDPDAATDHRRKAAREPAERILARAEFLPPEERQLIEAVYGDGWTIRRVAELSGTHPRVMSKRIARIVARAMSPEFTFVAMRQRTWRGTRRAVSRACVLHGLSQREAARRLGLSLHCVRRQHQAIRGMVEELL
jgi:DNA-directed RNA polymerase specialized sigma24 family protein